jgi:RNA polymerase sigma factor (sigma-70 family)
MPLNDSIYPEKDQHLKRMLFSHDLAEKERAWETLYRTGYPAVRDFVKRNSGSDQDAIDLFQDTLVIFHRNLLEGKFRGESTINTYLFSISRNLWFKELDRKQKYTVLPETFEDSPATEDCDVYLINEKIVTLLLKELKAECRDILVEYYFNQKSMNELKEIFGVNSVQAAKNKKYRCLGYLQRLYKEKAMALEV